MTVPEKPRSEIEARRDRVALSALLICEVEVKAILLLTGRSTRIEPKAQPELRCTPRL